MLSCANSDDAHIDDWSSLGSSNYGYSAHKMHSPCHVKAQVSIFCIHQFSGDKDELFL